MTIQIHELRFVPLISEAELQARVQAIGEALKTTHGTRNPLFISILSGAFVFAADVMRAFDAHCEVGFVKLSSYTGIQSSGTVQHVMGLDKDLTDRHLIVLEDIVDTGRTLHHFIEYLRDYKPASVTIVTLLRKPDAAQFDVPVDHVGFDIADRFVVGYGLDYDGLGRNLPAIYVLAGGQTDVEV
jgi:hypoxanthine phosphoribosyltransferase